MKINKRNQIKVDDWDDLVESTYNKIYSFQQQDECKDRGIETISTEDEEEDFENTEIPFEVNGEEMGVSFETWLNTSPEDTKKYFEFEYENKLFWERNFYPHVSMIIKDLYKKGLIEKGEYDINIDW
jgi:hypothetical protein